MAWWTREVLAILAITHDVGSLHDIRITADLTCNFCEGILFLKREVEFDVLPNSSLVVRFMAVTHITLEPDLCNFAARYVNNIFYVKCYVYFDNTNMVTVQVTLFHKSRETQYLISKSKIVPALAMNAYRRSRSTSSPILNLGARWRWMVNMTPRPLYRREWTPVPIEQEAAWASEPGWTFRRKE